MARPARTLALVALPVVAIAITAPTVAIALDSSPSPVIQGCLRPDGSIDKVAVDPANAPDCSAELLKPAGTVISWNQQGPAGTNGANGTNGTNGKDAYQVAKANGFPGTQLEWLTSLRGLPGAPGAKGADGKDGVSGYRMVVAETKAKARTSATYTVKCSGGRVALGGGMNGTAEMILNGSGPTADAKGWTVRVTNVATKKAPISVYVTCAFKA
ncbi:hypothetical protein [Sporichthya polymorpha]|uniref:hypothetical protein n=1 Tax=Sporichthya polymorpha TaxID=35751 RepID=UPI00036ADCD6|nr:hypothetical protein [Sporichthya polymorpha]